MTSSSELDTREPSGWAVGGTVFAATMLIMIGVFQFFQGLAAIIDDQFYVELPNYVYEVDTTAWGWIHMVIGALLLLTGVFLFQRSAVAGAIAMVLAALSAISNFFFMPYAPLWALLIIAIDIFVIWAIAKSGVFDS
jgi:hypothetical protein